MANSERPETVHQRTTKTLLVLRRLIAEGRYNIAGLRRKLAEEGLPSAERSVHRRLDDLRDLGDIFEFDAKRQAYRYIGGASPANVSLPDAAKKALGILRSLTRSVSPDLLAAIDEALELYLPQIRKTQLPISIQAEGLSMTEGEYAQYELVARSEAQRQVLAVAYRDRNGVDTKRQIEPYGFLVSQGLLFVLARDRNKNALRTFALAQMSELRLLPSTFVKPADFDIAQFGLNSPSGLFDGPPMEVRVRFAPRVASYARRTRLGKTQKAVEELLSGEVVLTLCVADPDELLRWVLSFGADAELLAPATLRAELAKLAQTIANQHRAALE